MSKKVKTALKVILIVLLVLAVLAGAAAWAVRHDPGEEPVSTDGAENPLITPLGVTMLSGHRAGGGIAPENTMMALKNCVENPDYELDIFEFDVHLTADNVLVLLHDESLKRTSNAVDIFWQTDVLVGEKTYEELRQVNMGAKFVADDGTMPYAPLLGDDVPDDLRITALDDALDYLESAGDYRYIIEIKNDGKRGCLAADELYESLTEHGCLDRTVVGTFHNEVTAYMDENYPDMPRSAGVKEAAKFYFSALLGLDIDPDSIGFAALQIPTTDYFVNMGTSRLVNYAHKYGVAVQYWTINDADEMARLQSIGADAIMTDLPDLGATILNQP